MVALIVPLGQYVRPRMFLHLDCGARAYPPRSYGAAPIWVFEGMPFGSQPGVRSVSREPAMGRLRCWFTDVGMTGFGALLPVADDAAYGRRCPPEPTFVSSSRGPSGRLGRRHS